jgi:diguanylate cyclase (GGDEF)-like protein
MHAGLLSRFETEQKTVSTFILGFETSTGTESQLVALPPAGADDAPKAPHESRLMNEWALDQIQGFLQGMRHASSWVHDIVGLSQFTVDLAVRLLCSRRSSLMVLDNQQLLRIMAARGLPDWVQEHTALRLGEGVAGRVASAGQPLLAESTRSTSSSNHAPGQYRSDTFLSVPVPGERKVLGVVNVTDPEDDAPFECGDLQQLINIADSVGCTLQQSIRFRELEAQAIRDELTGLHNRRYLYQFLETILDRSRVENFPVTLLLFDIDHFKRYNDQFGHPAGDEVLREVAHLMRENFRSHDVVCRLGGEEFAVVLWDGRGEAASSGWQAYPTTAFEFAERLRQATSRHRFRSINHVGITLSGGLATFPWDGGNTAELLQQADTALYRAKRDGRNRVYLCGAQPSV